VEVKIRVQHGIAHNLCLVIPREELGECLLSVPGWDRLVQSDGIVRHLIPEGFSKPRTYSYDPEEKKWKEGDEGIRKYKIPPEEHLEGLNLLDSYGRPTCRMILIGNRNLGNNFWFVAWHREKQPQCFRLKSEPIEERTHSCLVWYKDGHLGIESVKFQPEGDDYHPFRATDGENLAEKIEWCTFGQQVLRAGRLVDIEEIIDQFYDIRQVLYYPTSDEKGREELQKLYEGYPEGFRDRVLAAWREGRPRSRYLHNAIGIAPDKIIILQRHGTVEEIGQWLREEGAEDGIILDNGGSVFTWAWWAVRDVITIGDKKVVRRGNVIFSAPDWRPPTISLIAFVLKGPPRHEEPSGSVAFTVG